MALGTNLRRGFFESIITSFTGLLQNRDETARGVRGEAQGLAVTVPLPTYTAIDRARDLIRGLTAQHASGSAPRTLLDIDTLPILADPFKPADIDQAFERLVAGLASVFSEKRMPFETLETIYHAYQLFAAGVFLIPDQLIPPFSLGETTTDSPDGELVFNPFGMQFFIGERTELGRLPELIRHELIHLIQRIIGIQIGDTSMHIDIGSPRIISAVMVYFPSLVPEDAIFDYATYVQNAYSQYKLLKAYRNSFIVIHLLLKLGEANLNIIAEALGLASSANIGRTANKIYESIGLLGPINLRAFELSLIAKRLPRELIDTLLRIARVKAYLYITDPFEIEAFSLQEQGAVIGNPLLTLQAGSQRGIIQVPSLEDDRTRLYETLAAAAETRRTELLKSAGSDLRGGSRVVINGNSAIQRWIDPASPRYCDVRDLSKTVDRNARTIARHIETTGRIAVERVEFR